MMNENPPKLETAEQRATRLWRNNAIQRETKQLEPSTPTVVPIKTNITARQIILQIFAEKRNDILAHYQASIWHQKRRLMLEKIKRLERIHGQD